MSQPFGHPQPGELYKQDGLAPTRKVVAGSTGAGTGGGIGAAVAVLVLGYLQRQGWQFNPGEADAVTLLVAALIGGGIPALTSFIGGWLVRERAP